MNERKGISTALLILFLLLSSVGCLSSTSEQTQLPVETQPPTIIVDEGEDDHHEPGTGHGVPHEFEDMVNPVSADSTSLENGKEVYTKSCAPCHGPEGYGDGHMGMMLDPKPSNLHEEHVQENTDGALFYIITEGVEGTDMPGFRGLSEEDRWHLVNYLRTFEVEEHEH